VSDSDATSAAAPRRGRSLALRLVLIVLSVAVVVVGVAFVARTNQLNDQIASSNRALSDSNRTSEVIGEVSTALNQVFSYDYRNPQVAEAAAKRWLTGSAPAQYRTLFDQLEKLAPGQKLTFVAKVSVAGVTNLHGNHAQLLVFLDQQSTRASDGQSSISAAQVRIDAVRDGNLWRIDDIHPL
jgi:Mce-associated membrane protein